MASVFPWDGRDQEEQAEQRYNVRAQARQLEEENLRLKRLLRENGVPWNDSVASHPGFLSSNPHPVSGRRRSSRLSALDQSSLRLPHLPVEVVLRIMEYALIAEDVIIDPLSKLNPEVLTISETKRGAQIAIGFLATCKAYSVEGRRIFWAHNIFTFTSPEALRRFADLPYQFRRGMRHINLRVVARYFDDEKRTHRMDSDYHPDITKSQSLKIVQRTKDPASMSRSGFVSFLTTIIAIFSGSERLLTLI